MPIYEYKGQQYDISTDDPVLAKQKILKHLGTSADTPTTKWYEDIGAGLVEGVNRAAAGMGLAASALTTGDRQEELFSNIQQLREETKDTENRGEVGKVLKAVGSLPMYLNPATAGAAIAGGGVETGLQLSDEGASSGTALAGMGADIGLNVAAMGLLGKFGVQGRVKNALAQGGVNVAQEAAVNRPAQNLIRDDAGLKMLPMMSPGDIGAAFVPGAAIGAMTAKPRSGSSDPILDRGKQLQAEQEAAKPQRLPGEENLSLGDTVYSDKTLSAVDKTMQRTQKGTVAPQYDLQRAGVIDEFAPDSNYVNPKLNEQVGKDLTNADNLSRMQDPLTKNLPIEDRLRSNLELVPKEPEMPVVGQDGVPSRARDVIADKGAEMFAAELAAAREAAVKQTQIDAAFDLREQQQGVVAPPRAPNIDATIPSQSGGPKGLTGFGKSQRGSIGFKPPTFAEFSEKYSKAGFSPEVLARLYEETYSAKPSIKERVALSPTLSKQRDQANKTKFVNGKYFGDIIPNEEFIPAVKGIPDIDVGITKQKFVSSGRLQKELLDHPVTTQIYNIATKHIEEAGLASRRFLDDAGTGIFPILHHLNMTTFDGFKQAKEYFLNWRPKNEGLATELPPYFPDAIKRIHELEAKESAKLWKELEALRPENATKAKELLNHMVHLWHGPYRFYLTKETTNGRKKIVTYVAETSKADAQKAAAYFSKEHPDLEQTPIEFTPQMSRQRSSMFDHLLDISKEGDPVIAEALAAIIKTKEASMEKYAGTHQRFEHRSGVGGFLGQKPWLSERQNYKDTLSALREKYDAGYSWVALQKVKQEIRPLQDAIASGEVQTPKALVLGNKYIDHAFGRTAEQSNVTKAFDFVEGNVKGAGEVRRATKQVNQVLDKLTIPFLLGYKVSNIIQNLVQPMVSIPRLIMLANDAGGKLSTIPEAFAHGAVDGLFNFMDTVTLGKSAELSDRIFKKSELTQKIRTAIDDMDISRMSMADDRPFFGEGGMATSIGNKAIDVGLNGVLTIFEGPTRSWAFSTYARKFAADGASPERAIKMAAEQMDTMTNYNKEAAAQIFSDMGMAGMEAKGLHSFMVNYYTQLGQYIGKAVDGFKTASPKEAVPLAMYMAQTFMFAGALGFIGIDLAEALVNLVQQGVRGTNADSKKLQEFTPRKWLLENAPDSLSAGPVAAGTGLGTYGFFTTKVVDPDRTLLENLFPKTTAKIQIASGVVQLPKVFSNDTSEVEKGNILEKTLPRVFTPTIRRKFSEDGNVVLNRSQFKQGMPMYERTPEEAATAKSFHKLKATSEALNLEESIAGTKAEKRLNDSTNAQMQKLDTAFIQLANKKDPFSEANVGKLFNSLINDWGVDGNELGSRLEKLAEEHAINDAVVRRIVGTKNISSVSAMDRFKRTVDLQERQSKRQGK